MVCCEGLEESEAWVLGGMQRRAGAEGVVDQRGSRGPLSRPEKPTAGCTRTGALFVASVDKREPTLDVYQ